MDRAAIRELCIAHGHTPGRIGTLVEQPGANNQRNRLAYVDCASIEDASKLKTSLDRARKSQARPATISFRRTKAAEPSTELFISGIPSNSTEQTLRETFMEIPEMRIVRMKTLPASGPKRSFAILDFGSVEGATKVLSSVQSDGGQAFGLEGVEVRYGEPVIGRPAAVEPTTELILQRLPQTAEESVVKATMTNLGAITVTFRRNRTGDQAYATASFADIASAIAAKRALEKAQEATRLPQVEHVFRKPNDMLPPPQGTEAPRQDRKRNDRSPFAETQQPASISSWARSPSTRWPSSSSNRSPERADRLNRPIEPRSQRSNGDRRHSDAFGDGDSRRRQPAGAPFGIRSTNNDERPTGGYRSERRPYSMRTSSSAREGGYRRPVAALRDFRPAPRDD